MTLFPESSFQELELLGIRQGLGNWDQTEVKSEVLAGALFVKECLTAFSSSSMEIRELSRASQAQ